MSNSNAKRTQELPQKNIPSFHSLLACFMCARHVSCFQKQTLRSITHV